MRHFTVIAIAASFALAGLVSCGGSDTPAPEWELRDTGETPNGLVGLTVEARGPVTNEDETKALVEDVRAEMTDHAGYQVSIECTQQPGETLHTATATFGIGRVGEEAVGGDDIDLTMDKPCDPTPLIESQEAAEKAFRLIARRDRSGFCSLINSEDSEGELESCDNRVRVVISNTDAWDLPEYKSPQVDSVDGTIAVGRVSGDLFQLARDDGGEWHLEAFSPVTDPLPDAPIARLQATCAGFADRFEAEMGLIAMVGFGTPQVRLKQQAQRLVDQGRKGCQRLRDARTRSESW